jgi:hypothetical protein
MGTASHRFRLGWLSPSRGGISFKPWPWGGLWAVVSLPECSEKRKKRQQLFWQKNSHHRINFNRSPSQQPRSPSHHRINFNRKPKRPRHHRTTTPATENPKKISDEREIFVLQKPQQIFRPKVSIIQTENPKEQRDKERAERRESREKKEKKFRKK